jgi:carboxyl-terminal processing protease
MMTGEAGSTVKMKILRRGKNEPMQLAINREVVKIPAAKTNLMEGKIGVLKIFRLGVGSSDDARAKLHQLMKSGAEKIILDLRKCAGDNFEEGAQVANLFLDHGVIAFSQGQKFPKKEYVADASKAICKLPLVVLENTGSAGAAEIVAAAVKENRRGDLVGTRSFGKASIQKLIPLEGDSAILISVAKFYTQSGKIIQKNGIAPDYEVKNMADASSADLDDQEDEDSTAPAAPANKPATQEDSQMKKAIELLTATSQKAKTT